MGRRSLRKARTTVDLSRYLKTFEELPDPWNASALFGREARLEVEVGSGKGLFLAGSAAQNPGTNYLGIEIAKKYAAFCAARLAQKDLANACIIAGDALRIFEQRLPAGSVAAVHVYFPDPWWKKRHLKRRVLNPRFLANVERVLTPGGRLHFWTDVEEYFLATLEQIAESTSLVKLDTPAEATAEHDLDYRTHFERRTRLAGEPVFRSLFEKPAPAPSTVYNRPPGD